MFSRTPRGKSSSLNGNSCKRNRIKSSTITPEKGNGLPDCSLPRLGGETPSTVARSAVRSATAGTYAHIEAEVQTSPRDQVDATTSDISRGSGAADDLSTVRLTVFSLEDFQACEQAQNDAKRCNTRQETTPSHETDLEMKEVEKIWGSVVRVKMLHFFVRQSNEDLTPMKIRPISDIQVRNGILSLIPPWAPGPEDRAVDKADRGKDLSPGALPKMSTKDFLRRVYATEATPATTCSTPFRKQLSFESSAPGTPSVSTKIRPLTMSSTVELHSTPPPRSPSTSSALPRIERSMPLRMSQRPMTSPLHASSGNLGLSCCYPACERSAPITTYRVIRPVETSRVSAYTPSAFYSPPTRRFIPKYRSIAFNFPLYFGPPVSLTTGPLNRTSPVTVRSYSTYVHQ